MTIYIITWMYFGEDMKKGILEMKLSVHVTHAYVGFEF